MTDSTEVNETQRRRSRFFEEDNGNLSSMRLMNIFLLGKRGFLYPLTSADPSCIIGRPRR